MTFELTALPRGGSRPAMVPAAAAPMAEARDDIDACRARERSIRRQIQENCPYIPSFRSIRYEYRDGMLTVRGRVPSYYLKQLLHTYLRNLVHEEQIRDEVEVVSPARQGA